MPLSALTPAPVKTQTRREALIRFFTVSDSNFKCSKYIFFRPMAQRNFVPIGDERMSTNQDAIVRLIGWAGNMTASGLQFQGILTE